MRRALVLIAVVGTIIVPSACRQLLADGVGQAMVRLQQGDFKQLPDEIEARAPG